MKSSVGVHYLDSHVGVELGSCVPQGLDPTDKTATLSLSIQVYSPCMCNSKPSFSAFRLEPRPSYEFQVDQKHICSG